MSENTRDCKIVVPNFFVFDNPQVQNAANTVYESTKAFNARPANAASGKKYQFKTDFERMQYLLGLYGRDSQGKR